MLKWRIITAFILIPLVLLGLQASQVWFALGSSLVWLIGFQEWLNMSRLSLKAQIGILTLMAMAQIASFFILKQTHALFEMNLIFLVLATLSWLGPFIWIRQYNRQKRVSWLENPIARVGIGFWFLFNSWYALQILRLSAQETAVFFKVILALLLVVCATDTCAYFTGRLFGKKPLAPLISPKKTWAGFWGGIIGANVVAILYIIVNQNTFTWTLFIIASLAATPIALLSVLGDLFESLIKRISQVKDSGKILPGHGGVLDRLDSLLSTLPGYALFIHLIILLVNLY